MRSKFIYALIVFTFSSCSELKAQQYNNCFKLKESVLVDSLKLRIDFLINNQSYLVRLFYNQEIVDEILLFGVEMNSKIKPVILDNLTERVSLLCNFSVVGSTFGAFTTIIIWSDGNSWNITKAPFIRPYLVDVDRDRIFEFKEAYGVFAKRIFRFRFGFFVEK